MTPLDKVDIHQTLVEELRLRERKIQEELIMLRNDVAGDTKSTAGDKHETSRAMNQLEQERILGQLQTVRIQLHTILKMDTSLVLPKIGFGSVIQTNLSIFFISIGIGLLTSNNQKIFCIGQDAPISQFLLGKSVGTHQWNGKALVIQQIY
jgi:hypothetical protein